MIGHVIEADHAYAREIGVRMPEPSFADRAAVEAERAAVLDALRHRPMARPLADRKWTPRYAARRIAWHALDHAWEMEDRAEHGTVIRSATVAPVRQPRPCRRLDDLLARPAGGPQLAHARVAR